MKRLLSILLFAVILSAFPADVPGYIGPPVVVRLCQILPRLCAK